MPSRTRGRSARRGSPRKQGAWFNSLSAPVAIAIGGQAIIDLTPLAGVPEGFGGGFTVRRMIGWFTGLAAAGNLTVTGALGIYVGDRDAFAAGAVADPLVDLMDWYYLNGYTRRADVAAERSAPPLGEFDIRSGRRIRGENRTLIAVLDVSAAAAASLDDFQLFVRLYLQRS